MHRAELHRILLESLDGVDLHPGHRATGVAVGADSASVDIEGPSGRFTVAADVVVAADGIGSPLRATLFPDYPGPSYAGYTVWRGIVPADEAGRIGVDKVLSETWGRAARFGIAVINDGQVYWFACESAPEHADARHSLDEVATRFRDWHHPIPQLLVATPPDSLLQHDVHYLKTPLPSFVRGRVALLGDAAHAVTPDIGQGACLAIEDAAVLAATLHHGDVDEALAAYDRVRRPRTQRLARTSGRLARILQIGNPAGVRLRDTVVRSARCRRRGHHRTGGVLVTRPSGGRPRSGRTLPRWPKPRAHDVLPVRRRPPCG